MDPLSARPIPTPCTGVCTIDDGGYCLGCHRSMAEITRWARMDDDERLHLMEVVLPERGARGR